MDAKNSQKVKWIWLGVVGLGLICLVLVFVVGSDYWNIFKGSNKTEIIGFGAPPAEEFIPKTDEEVLEMLEVTKQITRNFSENFQNLRQSMDAHDALQKAVDDLKTNPDVMAVTYQYKSLTIYSRLGDDTTLMLDAWCRRDSPEEFCF